MSQPFQLSELRKINLICCWRLRGSYASSRQFGRFVLPLGLLAGIPGVLLATPLTAALVVLIKKLYVEDTLENAKAAKPVSTAKAPMQFKVRATDERKYCNLGAVQSVERSMN